MLDKFKYLVYIPLAFFRYRRKRILKTQLTE